MKKISIPGKNRLPIVLGFCLLLAVGTAGYYFVQYRNVRADVQAKTSTEDEVIELIAEVGKVFLLPEGETPKVLTILERDKLEGQTFFARSQNGDKVLVYEQARKAIIYRKELGKVIDSGPLSESAAGGASSTPTPTASATPKPR